MKKMGEAAASKSVIFPFCNMPKIPGNTFALVLSMVIILVLNTCNSL